MITAAAGARDGVSAAPRSSWSTTSRRLGEVLSRYLERAGFDTRVACDGPQAIEMSAQRSPDLVVLDLMMPGIDGLRVMRRLREQPGTRPAVILLTARGEEADRIVGLRRGADDYVVKPFSPRELVARVQAVLRRGGDPDDARPLEFDGLRIDPVARTVRARATRRVASDPARVRSARVSGSSSGARVLARPVDGDGVAL